MGCARTFQNGFIDQLGDGLFLLNCLDALTLDEDLLLVRSKQAKDRRFDKPSESAAFFWSALPLGIVPLGLIAIGLTIGTLRMRRREAWDLDQGRQP